VQNNLILFEYQPPAQAAGYSSGGYMSNSRVEGQCQSGSQQQWFTRNSELKGGWQSGVWNMVFVGTKGAPASHCGSGTPGPYTTVDSTPTIAEKPFITIDSTGKFSLQIPAAKHNTSGVDWDTPATTVGFELVYVADNTTDTAASINAQLAAGNHVVLSPGIYSLTEPIVVNKDNLVLLGLGMATLVSANGNMVIQVGNVDGVRIAGPIILQAGSKPTTTLLQWGSGVYAGDSTNPGIIQDVFARVGGPDAYPVQADVMLELNSGNVLVDNTWLWRADHTVSGLVKDAANPCQHGLVVKGDDVTMYGLAVEHTLDDLVVWSGQRGATYFFQSELPYDVTPAQWGTHVGYRVSNDVTTHNAFGMGVYHFFRDYPVNATTGIVVPDALVSSVVNPLAVFLNGLGSMQHVINALGSSTETVGGGADPKWFCNL
jgi:hypothetical protein